jgi:hypothetical protein
MKIVSYQTEEENNYFDFDTIRKFTRLSKSKLYRDLNKLKEKNIIQYKNQFLYSENTLFQLLENICLEKINNIIKTNGF